VSFAEKDAFSIKSDSGVYLFEEFIRSSRLNAQLYDMLDDIIVPLISTHIEVTVRKTLRRSSKMQRRYLSERYRSSSVSRGDNIDVYLMSGSGHKVGRNFLVLRYHLCPDHSPRLSVNRKSDLPILAAFLFHLRHGNVVPSRSAEDL
jgi:hypothetical protein